MEYRKSMEDDVYNELVKSINRIAERRRCCKIGPFEITINSRSSNIETSQRREPTQVEQDMFRQMARERTWSPQDQQEFLRTGTALAWCRLLDLTHHIAIDVS